MKIFKTKAEKEIKIDKDKSPNITKEKKFKTIIGDLLVYNEKLEPIGYDNPRITLAVSEDLAKHQRGLARITIKEQVDEDEKSKNFVEKSYLVHIDGIMGTIYRAYAPKMINLDKIKQDEEKRNPQQLT